MTGNRKLSGAAAVLLMLCGAAAAQDGGVVQPTLQWKWTAGEKLSVVSQRTAEDTTIVDGKSETTTSDIQTFLTWETKAVYTDLADVRITFDRLAMNMKIGDADPVSYDTASGQEAISFDRFFAQQIDPMIGCAFLQRMNRSGEVVEALMEPASLARLRAKGDASKNGFFDEDALRKVIRQSAAELPNKVLQPGDSWKNAEETTAPFGRMRMDTTYTYRGPANDSTNESLHKIDLAMKLTLLPDRGLERSIAVREQDIRGVMYFDSRLGRVVGSEVTQNVTLQLDQNGKSVQKQMKSTTRMTVTPAAQTARNPGGEPR